MKDLQVDAYKRKYHDKVSVYLSDVNFTYMEWCKWNFSWQQAYKHQYKIQSKVQSGLF